jgi:hypothetical protein
MKEINELALHAKETGSNFICLTASVQSEIKEFIDKTNAPFQFYNTDEITLKTIVRSNPGLVLLRKGRILGKWHHRNIPDIEDITNDFLQNELYKSSENTDEILAFIN